MFIHAPDVGVKCIVTRGFLPCHAVTVGLLEGGIVVLHGDRGVVWASDGPLTVWFDIAQDLKEPWVPQVQMRLAVHQVGSQAADYLPEVLRTFVWAFPHTSIGPMPPPAPQSCLI